MNAQIKTGECEADCNRTDIKVQLMHGNIWMCDECREKEEKALALTAREQNARQLINDSRVVDSKISLKQHIYNAKTVAAIELRAAIENNPDIKPEDKEYVFACEGMARFKNLERVIFEERAALLEKENELKMWQTTVQTAAGKLRTELREQFKSLNVGYQPGPITKKQKTTKPVTKSFNRKEQAELYAAAKQYEVPASGVQSIKLSHRDWTYEACAKHLASLIGKA